MRIHDSCIHVQLKGCIDTFVIDVNFRCPLTGITSIYGPSGCGKTTLLRAIAGLHPLQGKIRVGEQIWQDHDANIFLPAHRRSVGYVFQEASLFPHLDVAGNLHYGLKRTKPGNRSVAYENAVELLGLDKLLQRHPHQLSGGQRQRVAISRALLKSPDLLIMDEPLAALDTKSKNEILPYLETMHTELAIPILYVSHSADEVARLSDYLVLLKDGGLSASGPITELHTRLDIAYEAGNDADALIDAKLISHDDHYQLSHLMSTDITFTVTRIDQPVGSTIRIRVLARDVSISLEPSSCTSILNVFPARVMEILKAGESQVLIKLNTGENILLARITLKSADHLELRPGKEVYAQVKAAALL